MIQRHSLATGNDTNTRGTRVSIAGVPQCQIDALTERGIPIDENGFAVIPRDSDLVVYRINPPHVQQMLSRQRMPRRRTPKMRVRR